MNLAIYGRIDVSKEKLSGVIANRAKRDETECFCATTNALIRVEKLLKKPSQTGDLWLFTLKWILRVVGVSPQGQGI